MAPPLVIPCSPAHRVHCSPWHRELVDAYRAARAADEERRDVEAGGTTEEWQAFTRTMVTFRRWLVTNSGVSRA